VKREPRIKVLFAAPSDFFLEGTFDQ